MAFYQSGGARKTIILVLIGCWLVGYFLNCNEAQWKPFLVLAILLVLYLFEIIYSMTTSSKTSEFFKSFIFQTAVPLVALSAVCIMAVLGKIEGTTIITLFGLSLAYTTYVVGRRIKGDRVDTQEEPDDSQ